MNADISNVSLSAASMYGASIGGNNSTDFAITNNSCTGSLQGGAHCQVSLNFIPDAVGNRTAKLLISDDGGGSPQGGQLTGKGITNISVAVHPRAIPLTFTKLQKFIATLSNTSDQRVTWKADGVAWGNSIVGTIDQEGVYRPPAQIGTHTITATSVVDPSKRADATAYIVDNPGVVTNKNDNARTGQNLQEVVLTPANVNVSTFGKLFTYAVDGWIFAQPLYVANVYLPQPINAPPGYYNLVYVATSHDTVYAFDADGGVPGPLWQVSFLTSSNVIPVPGTCLNWPQPEFGITATPVIDLMTNAIYVNARTIEGATDPANPCTTGHFVQRLHALDLTNGGELFGGPVVIQASVPGNGAGSDGNGNTPFDAQNENTRVGMLLSKTSTDPNNVVYMAFAVIKEREHSPYHGWVLGYDGYTLALRYAYNTTPNGEAGGIWQSGGGISADSTGNLYVQTGNGTFDASQSNYGQSALKLSPNNAALLTVADYFTPYEYASLNDTDWDLSSGGLLLLPDQPGAHPHEMIGGGKEGIIYVLDRDDLGQYNSTSDNIVQAITGAIQPSVGTVFNGIWNIAGYFDHKVYIFGHHDYPKMFALANGLLPASATSTGLVSMRSPAPVFSANGTANGIVWILQWEASRLWAFDPNDLTHEFYDTTQNSARDMPSGGMVKMTPTIANGRVYFGTKTELAVYGLLP